MKLLLAIFFSLATISTSSAQIEKIIHQTFGVGDVPHITLDLVGDVTIVPWAGNTIMTETSIQLYEASPSILQHFLVKEKRYAIEVDTVGNAFRLYSFDQERKEIRTRSGFCPEIVHLKVFVPDVYQVRDDNTLVKAVE